MKLVDASLKAIVGSMCAEGVAVLSLMISVIVLGVLGGNWNIGLSISLTMMILFAGMSLVSLILYVIANIKERHLLS